MNRSLLATPLVLACVAGLAGLAGCGEGGDSSAGVSEAERMAELFDQQTAVEEKKSEVEDLAGVAKAARAKADRLAAEAPSEVSNQDMKRGKKIKGSGLLRSSLKAGQEAKNKLNMLEWQQALQLYTASNNLNPPETHEEFMTEVIEANGLTLEPLLEPYEYWYDPEQVNLLKRVKQEAIDEAEAEAQAAEAALAEAE